MTTFMTDVVHHFHLLKYDTDGSGQDFVSVFGLDSNSGNRGFDSLHAKMRRRRHGYSGGPVFFVEVTVGSLHRCKRRISNCPAPLDVAVRVRRAGGSHALPSGTHAAARAGDGAPGHSFLP